MSDLDLGMNRWACEGFTYPDQPMDRGKVVRDKDVFEAFETLGDTLMLTATVSHTAPFQVPEWLQFFTVERAQPHGVYSEKPEDYFNLMAVSSERSTAPGRTCPHQSA
jgi:2-oxoglutarate ferredoxin oxidoreductase subunit alpha